jgi:hypothetical protein
MFAPVGEVSVNPGGEPERDETGLPPVDIEIPDDARELDRDVQAYYRELRAQRRHQRGLRTRGSLAKDGILLPLLACCLILALITGTLLTVFTATSDQTPLSSIGKPTAQPKTARSGVSGAPSGGATSAPASPSAPAPSASPQPDTVPTMLPAATIFVPGQAPTLVRNLRRAALVLIPTHCNCTATVSWLINVVASAHAQTYLVYTTSSQDNVDGVYWSLGGSERAKAWLALETDDLLSDSVSSTLQASGPTAILLGPHKVAYASGLNPLDAQTALIYALTH